MRFDLRTSNESARRGKSDLPPHRRGTMSCFLRLFFILLPNRRTGTGENLSPLRPIGYRFYFSRETFNESRLYFIRVFNLVAEGRISAAHRDASRVTIEQLHATRFNFHGASLVSRRGTTVFDLGFVEASFLRAMYVVSSLASYSLRSTEEEYCYEWQ